MLTKILKDKRTWVIAALAFTSGLPLALSGSTLRAWLTEADVDIKTIGISTLIGLPYIYKFLWAPLFDNYSLPLLGRRRGWSVVFQFVLMLTLFWMGIQSPDKSPNLLLILGLLLATASASQDVLVDAYRTELMPNPNQRSIAAGLAVTGYRIGMIVAGPVALLVAARYGWQAAYFLMAGLMLLGVVANIKGPEPTYQRPERPSAMAAIGEYFSRPNAGLIVLVIALYNLGDAFAQSLSLTFLLRGLDFSLEEVGLIYKLGGLIAGTVGGLFAAGAMIRWGLLRSMIVFAILQLITNFAFIALAVVGKSYPLFVLAVVVENAAGGMGNAVLVAFMMSLCNIRYTAVQFAMLSAFASLGRVYIGPIAADVVEKFGWLSFYLWSLPLAVPVVILVYFLRHSIKKLDSEDDLTRKYAFGKAKTNINKFRNNWSWSAALFGPLWALEHGTHKLLLTYLLLTTASVALLFHYSDLSAPLFDPSHIGAILSMIVTILLAPLVAAGIFSLELWQQGAHLVAVILLAANLAFLGFMGSHAKRAASKRDLWVESEEMMTLQSGYDRAGFFFTGYALVTFILATV